MRHSHAVAIAALLTFALAAPSRAQGTATRASIAAQERVYSSDSNAFVVGRQVYLRSTKTFIGHILAVDANHAFPADRFPRARMKAILIERRDGPLEWVPVERITRIYVVK